MIHIYGHSWPVRWGKPDETKQIKIFSNCSEVELFLNGVSIGNKRRNSADYPAAGLRWDMKIREGRNQLRAIGRHSGVEVIDEIFIEYQTAVWSKPAKFVLREIGRTEGTVTIETRVFDAAGVPCLDAANLVRFSLIGDGQLIDNLGTAHGSRAVQLANGRAQITLQLTGDKSVASVSSKGLPTEFLHISNQRQSPSPMK